MNRPHLLIVLLFVCYAATAFSQGKKVTRAEYEAALPKVMGVVPWRGKAHREIRTTEVVDTGNPSLSYTQKEIVERDAARSAHHRVEAAGGKPEREWITIGDDMYLRRDGGKWELIPQSDSAPPAPHAFRPFGLIALMPNLNPDGPRTKADYRLGGPVECKKQTCFVYYRRVRQRNAANKIEQEQINEYWLLPNGEPLKVEQLNTKFTSGSKITRRVTSEWELDPAVSILPPEM
jgi:hypothetical protein